LSIDEGGKQIVPDDVALFGVYPNPFNSATKILFALTEPAEVSVDIFDLCGRLVREFAPKKCVEKSYTVVWDGRDNSGKDLPSGVYLVKLSTGKTVLTRKVFLSR
ncbi:MAG TPA: T9SS type A sorting domain-containing protein, partial [candidate division Zixibacteria bacterium]|nr:T9SS type A sorting domain-containing protein [candidate division Zixibacteria bacterium]